MIVGYLVSYLTRKLMKEDIRPMDTNLFVPPLARKLEKQWDRPLNMKTVEEFEEDARNADRIKHDVTENNSY